MIGIYGIKNKINGKIYIGQSINIIQRWRRHRTDSRRRNFIGENYPIYRAINKYGLNNFDFIVIEECDKNELNEKEIYWIKKYNSTNDEKGYNVSPGGDYVRGPYKLTEEDIKEIIDLLENTYMSIIDIGKNFNVTNQMVSAINTGKNWRQSDKNYPLRNSFLLSKRYSEDNYCIDCGKKISKKAKRCTDCYGIYQRSVERPSPLELAKMVVERGFTEVGRQFNVSNNAIKKWCKAYNIPYLKPELKEWYYEQIGKELPPKKEKIKVKKIKQIDSMTGEILAVYDSANEAGRALNKINGSHINKVCNGERKTAYGFKWEYIEE